MNSLEKLLGQHEQICSKYDTFREIGSGAYGTVYELYNGQTSSEIVLKRYLPSEDERDRRRFLREIDILLELKDNPHVVDILEYSKESDFPWYTMPKATATLHEYVEKLVFESHEEEMYRIIESVMDALEDAHEREILHRDLAPSNILIFEDASRELDVKVSDFGLGRNFSTGSAPLSKTADNRLGQAAFTAPEQLFSIKDASVRSDIYSLGALISFIFTQGQDPRFVKPMTGIRFVVNECMKREPMKRPNSVLEVRRIVGTIRGMSTGTKGTIEEIKTSFEANGTLSDKELLDLGDLLLKTRNYDYGRSTYLSYFQPLINIPFNLLEYWLQHAEQDFIKKFVDNYCEQMTRISHQVGWSFSLMLEIGNVMFLTYNNSNDTDVRTQILSTFIDIQPSFGELSKGLERMLTAQYSDERQLQNLAMVLRTKKTVVAPFFSRVEEKVKHYAFIEIFSD
ncbi:serine/threonine-protein kinase [Alicyclobacillus sp. SO9]|uniref:serine/threonine-protein kinase n=1 Tax=Alicyclobacillus sp. SO9 TaxID=2665646 RepID=UPI0018E82E2A|nr:serine/threonine-protein kinase [Alicyclobacillus sp. SO9]QQE77756.1 serine/threonine protein kinase [Alicyclobacillus sp. SO9]